MIDQNFCLPASALLLLSLTACDGGHSHSHHHPQPGGDASTQVTASAFEGADCVTGTAAGYFCRNIALSGGLAFSVEASDIWGWQDSVNGDEYAVLGLATGTAFIRITDPANPEFIGYLPTATFSSGWRDVKVINDHAVVVSEADSHGLQVLDLSVLAGLSEYTELTPTVRYTGFGEAHNVAVNEETGFVYAVGTDTCAGGLHMIDFTNPANPVFAGCYADDAYTHDVQCVVYSGPDMDHLGREICFASNEDTLTVVDVTDKTAPVLVSRTGYPGSVYTHQGWLSEDQRYFFLGDELDEETFGHNTRTYIWSMADLDLPQQTHVYTADTKAIDHNLYVQGDHLFQANYTAGVRVLRMGNLSQGELSEVAFFDTVPATDDAEFAGVWSVYPYLESGNVITANISGEFFVLQPNLDAEPRCDDGLDNDADGLTDYPEDSTCTSAIGEFEQ